MSGSGSTIDATGLPQAAGAAAAAFHATHAAEVRACAAGADSVLVLFAEEAGGLQSWRLAAIQDLARELAPVRINGLALDPAQPAGGDRVRDFLARAPGVTGQMFAVDGNSGENC